MKISNIETKKGNDFLESLIKTDGWEIIAQYDTRAIDKGIDFDSYTIAKSGQHLKFEWANWDEWEITGKKELLTVLATKYSLT